ncbi:MAG: PAS domain-containing sensor histidine kinase [Thiocapsa sp.]|uniref:PAS domain-containing sensor histidine kinase n=1 Tax=Thiocapsa sp. TaxID=2024551 RepID=UPI001BCBA58D|nr:PAS domain-containing sensor histidine kinase [Thiocapsa sp.]QVL47613.1 MAG: PAS domain-containing sensor histidine kinase [Thiocapsa sp.]
MTISDHWIETVAGDPDHPRPLDRAAARLTGYPADVVMHRGFSELFPETERPEVEMALSRATVLPGSLSEEWTLSTASGEGLAVSWTIAPMSSEDGTLIGMEKMTLVEPLALLKQALSVVSHQAQIARIEVEMQVGDRPLWARGVPSLLEQAFINLFLNAIAAMPAGGRLTIEVDQKGDEVSVQISDTGVGIHAADLLRIFDPFYTRSPIGQGTGLGLSICYSIIEQHRGRIDVQSEIGVGTCFHVRLPLAEPPCSDDA